MQVSDQIQQTIGRSWWLILLFGIVSTMFGVMALVNPMAAGASLTWAIGILAVAGLIGLYAIHRLSLVREQGEIERRAMVGQVLNETRRSIRNISSVAGLRAATDLPGALLRDARTRIRLKRAQAARAGRMH